MRLTRLLSLIWDVVVYSHIHWLWSYIIYSHIIHTHTHITYWLLQYVASSLQFSTIRVERTLHGTRRSWLNEPLLRGRCQDALWMPCNRPWVVFLLCLASCFVNINVRFYSFYLLSVWPSRPLCWILWILFSCIAFLCLLALSCPAMKLLLALRLLSSTERKFGRTF